jgi:hypothetical protein
MTENKKLNRNQNAPYLSDVVRGVFIVSFPSEVYGPNASSEAYVSSCEEQFTKAHLLFL